MTDTAELAVHDSCVISVAGDGDVCIVTDTLGLRHGDHVEVATVGERLVVRQGGRTFLDAPMTADDAAVMDAAGAVVLVEVRIGDTPDRDEHVTHRDVRRGA